MSAMTAAISPADVLAERLFGAARGALELCLVCLGAEFGLCEGLAERGPETAGGVARAAGIAPDELERMMFGRTVTCRLPTLAEHPSTALGSVLRTGTVRDLASHAGIAAVDLLPVENDFSRLYRLS